MEDTKIDISAARKGRITILEPRVKCTSKGLIIKGDMKLERLNCLRVQTKCD